MKKLFSIVSVLVLCLSLASCGGSDKDTASDASSTVGGSSEGYVFTANGVDIRVGDVADGVIAKLGSDYTYTEEASCFFEGSTDKNYTYANFSVTTSNNGSDFICYVKLLNDLVKTPEGIAIGDSADDVTAKYGDGFTESGSYRVYKKGNMSLKFQLADNEVTSVIYQLNQD